MIDAIDFNKVHAVTVDIMGADNPGAALKELILRDDLTPDEKVEVLRLIMFSLMSYTSSRNQSKVKTFKPEWQL